MEDRSGDIYLWNGQEIIYYHPRIFVHKILTKTARRKRFARVVYLKSNLSKKNNLHSDSIYLLGGKIAEEGATNQVECYSLRRNIW